MLWTVLVVVLSGIVWMMTWKSFLSGIDTSFFSVTSLFIFCCIDAVFNPMKKVAKSKMLKKFIVEAIGSDWLIFQSYVKCEFYDVYCGNEPGRTESLNLLPVK